MGTHCEQLKFAPESIEKPHRRSLLDFAAPGMIDIENNRPKTRPGKGATDGDEDSGRVVAMGSRIFAEGAEAAGAALVTPAKDRRQKRSMRRQVQRRTKRRQRIRTELSVLGLLPVDDREFESLMASDPAVLIDRSSRGEELTLREIGRVVYWFSSRRGFLSLLFLCSSSGCSGSSSSSSSSVYCYVQRPGLESRRFRMRFYCRFEGNRGRFGHR